MSAAKYRAQRIALRQCQDCGADAAPSLTTCLMHAVSRREKQRARAGHVKRQLSSASYQVCAK